MLLSFCAPVSAFEKDTMIFRLGVWLPNQYDWVRFAFASMEVGGICVNVNPAYRSQELKHALNLTGIHTLVMRPVLKTSNYQEVIFSKHRT